MLHHHGVAVWLAVCAGSVAHVACVATARADVVHTADGSRLVGTIKVMSGDKLVIETDIAGRLEIDAAKVVAVETSAPVTVEFDSGDRLVGVMTAPGGGDSSVMQTALGELEVDAGRIKSMWRVGEPSPEVVAERELAAKRLEAYKPDWNFTLEAGVNMTEGNTETLNARGRLDLKRKTQDDLLAFFLAADYAENNDIRNRNEIRGGVTYENDLTQKWFWYSRLLLEYDEFENLDLRSLAAAGVGYYWIRRPEHELKNRMGVGYRHEAYNDGVTRDEAVLDLGLDYRVDIAPWLQFTHTANYSPEFEDFDNYRLDFDTALLVPLKPDVLKFKIGMRNEYNSRPRGGLERLDNTYYANLVITLVK